jgi:arsenite-transporting ATPase
MERLNVFTGKGGVGKTLLAHAFALKLEKQGKKIKIVCFESEIHSADLAMKLQLPYWGLKLHESAKLYLIKKMRSEIVASFIMRAPFFQSILGMMPALSFLVFLGHIVDSLRDDPDLYLIADAPATGHTLGLFESLGTFQKIFRKGVLFDDVEKTMSFLQQDEGLRIWSIATPSLFSLQENEELVQGLKKRGVKNFSTILNMPLYPLKIDREKEPYLGKKAELEELALIEYKNLWKWVIPFLPEETEVDIAIKASAWMQEK